jgi:hypothetical protein
MEHNGSLRFTPVDHPDSRIRRIGFDLTDPYIEICWTALVGPSSITLLRRLPTLWVARVPAELDAGELSRTLGLGAGTSRRSRLSLTLDRIARFGLGRPEPVDPGLQVYRQVAPLKPRQLQSLPQWTVDAHERLLSEHLEQLQQTALSPTASASAAARLHGPPCDVGDTRSSSGQGLNR